MITVDLAISGSAARIPICEYLLKRTGYEKMRELVFRTPPRLVCGVGALKQLGELASDLGGTRALIVTDLGIVDQGFDQQAVQALCSAGVSVCVFDKVEADPPYKIVLEAISAAKSSDADIVIGLGGGSSMDTAKVVALAVNSEQTLADMVGTEQATGERLPLITIPTTAGTGSEVTFVSVLTDDCGDKQAIYSHKLLPDIALLDASLTTKLPPHITAAPALDAIVHAVEAYTSRTRKNPISDALAVKALELLGDNFMTVLKDGENIEARAAMLLGSTLAGMAFVNSSVAAVHALSYPLGVKFHIPHGHSNALVMGPVFRFNMREAKREYAELAAILLADENFDSDEQAANAFISRLEEMLEFSGLETRLSQLGVKLEDIQEMSIMVNEKLNRLISTNPRDMTSDDIYSLYKSVL